MTALERDDYPYSQPTFRLGGRELEARIGQFSTGDRQNFRGATQEQYQNVLSRLQREYPEASDYKPVDTTVRLYPNDIRMIVSGHDRDHTVFWNSNHALGRPEAQHWETKLKSAGLQTDVFRRGIRFAVSAEQEVAKPAVYMPPQTVRYRSRITVPIGVNQVDLTRTVSVNGSQVLKPDRADYEIEVEYMGSSDELAEHLDEFYDLVEAVYEAANFFDLEDDVPGLAYMLDERNEMIAYVMTRLSDGVQLQDLGRKISVKDYLAKPRSMKKKDLVAPGLYGLQPRRHRKGKKPELLEKYYATFKSDGVRALLVSNLTGLWIYYPGVYSRLVARRRDYPTVPMFILDGEFIEAEGEVDLFIPFDLLAVLGRLTKKPKSGQPSIDDYPSYNMTIEGYTERLALMAKVLDAIPELTRLQILEKEIMLLDQMDSEAGFTRLAEMLETRENQPFKTDGLIFTPADQPYYRSSSTREKLSARVLSSYPDVVKWKPPSMLTVDFEISFSRIGEITLSSNDSASGHGATPFQGTVDYPFDQSMVNSRAEMTRGLPDKTIVEYEWDPIKKWFTPYALRTDKSSPNSLDVALDNWASIHDPIEEIDLLRGYSRAPNATTAMVKNEIYRQVISFYRTVPKWDLLEVGSGQGGERERWLKLPASVRRILALEPNQEFVREMESRLADLQEPPTWKVVPIVKKAEDVSVLRSLKTKGKPVRLATSSMLSGSFFGDSPNRLRRFVHLMTRGNIASFYTISVEGMEAALGPIEDWVVGQTYEVYPAMLTIMALEPVTIRYRNIQSTTAGDQVEYPLRLTELIAELEAQGFTTTIGDLSKFVAREIPTVRRYMSLYQYVKATSKTRVSLDQERLLARDLVRGETEALGATDYSDLMRTRRSAITIDGAILGQVPALAKLVAVQRAGDLRLKKRDGLMIRASLTADLSSDDKFQAQLDRFLNRVKLGLRVFDVDTGEVIYEQESGSGPLVMISRARSQLGEEPGYVYDRVISAR